MAFFTMTGISLGFIPLIIVFAAMLSVSSNIPEKYEMEILPNAEGIRKEMADTVPVILKINISGVIGTDSLNMNTIRELLVESREGDLKGRVKGIILHIESPGGTVVDSDGIYRAIQHYKKAYNVPVFAYVDGLCASGGMYVASAADKIYSSSVSIIGSIGVVSPPFMNFVDLMDKLGVKALTLSAGKGKDDLNPFRPWREGEQDTLEGIINYYYNDFVAIVSGSRQIDKSKLIDDYGAKVFPAEKAMEIGYIDGYDLSLSDTLKLMLKKLGIEDNDYQVVGLKPKTWFSTLFTGESKARLFHGEVSHRLDLGPYNEPFLQGKFLYLYYPEK